MAWKITHADLERYRKLTLDDGAPPRVRLAYYEALLRLQPDKIHISGWWGEALILVGGLLAYFFNFAFLAVSIFGLSVVLGNTDTHTRSCVVALVECLEELSKQIESGQNERERVRTRKKSA